MPCLVVSRPSSKNRIIVYGVRPTTSLSNNLLFPPLTEMEVSHHCVFLSWCSIPVFRSFSACGCKLCIGFLSLFVLHRLGFWSTYFWISSEYLQIFLGIRYRIYWRNIRYRYCHNMPWSPRYRYWRNTRVCIKVDMLKGLIIKLFTTSLPTFPILRTIDRTKQLTE